MTDRPAPGASRLAPAERLAWQGATVVAIRRETARALTFVLRLERPTSYVPGQHYVLRLTAPDGYTASRSYSIASAPDGGDTIELTVEALDEGEVSGYLHEVAAVGDRLEVRGPIGRWFTWRGEFPALLIGGGSGVVPLMSMLRWARRHPERAAPHRLVVSARSPGELLFADELPGPEVKVIWTRQGPPGWSGPVGRMTAEQLAPALLPGAVAYVCGTDGFADAVTSLLTGLGHPADAIRVERFGATG